MLFQVKYKVRYKVLSVIQSLMQSVITKCYTKCNAKCIDVFIFWSQNIQRWTVQYFNIRRNTRTSDNCTACYDISGYKLHRVKTSLPASDNCFQISLVTSTHCTIVGKTLAHPIKDNVEFVDTDIWHDMAQRNTWEVNRHCLCTLLYSQVPQLPKWVGEPAVWLPSLSYPCHVLALISMVWHWRSPNGKCIRNALLESESQMWRLHVGSISWVPRLTWGSWQPSGETGLTSPNLSSSTWMGWIALRTPPFVYLQFFWYTCIWLISIAMHCLSIDKLCVLKGVLKQAAQEEVFSHWLHLSGFSPVWAKHGGDDH